MSKCASGPALCARAMHQARAQERAERCISQHPAPSAHAHPLPTRPTTPNTEAAAVAVEAERAKKRAGASVAAATAAKVAAGAASAAALAASLERGAADALEVGRVLSCQPFALLCCQPFALLPACSRAVAAACCSLHACPSLGSRAKTPASMCTEARKHLPADLVSFAERGAPGRCFLPALASLQLFRSQHRHWYCLVPLPLRPLPLRPCSPSASPPLLSLCLSALALTRSLAFSLHSLARARALSLSRTHHTLTNSGTVGQPAAETQSDPLCCPLSGGCTVVERQIRWTASKLQWGLRLQVWG